MPPYSLSQSFPHLFSSRALRASPGTPYRSRTLASDRALIETSMQYDLIMCSRASNYPSARQIEKNRSRLKDFRPNPPPPDFARGASENLDMHWGSSTP